MHLGRLCFRPVFWRQRRHRQFGDRDNHQPRPKIESERHHVLDVVQARFEILGHVQAAPQGAGDRGDGQIMGPQQMRDLTPARLRQAPRRQFPARLQLDRRAANFFAADNERLKGSPSDF